MFIIIIIIIIISSSSSIIVSIIIVIDKYIYIYCNNTNNNTNNNRKMKRKKSTNNNIPTNEEMRKVRIAVLPEDGSYVLASMHTMPKCKHNSNIGVALTEYTRTRCISGFKKD